MSNKFMDEVEKISNKNKLEQLESNLDYEIISINEYNPSLRSPNSQLDLSFYETKESLSDPEVYRAFIKNAENRFRRSREYKMVKAHLMSLGFNHCQIMGNIEDGDNVEIELHHNILNLFDIMILICEHVLNTVGMISTFDLIQLTIVEHIEHRVPITFLSATAHQMYTNDPNGYIPPDMTFGKWWELLKKYCYGITYNIANKVIEYSKKYYNQLPVSINIQQQEQILNFAHYNECGIPLNNTQYGIDQNYNNLYQ